MPKSIEMVRPFSHADKIYPVTYVPGVYAVAEGAPLPGEVSARCAEVALAEGYAREMAGRRAASADAPQPRHAGGGVYELPDGRRVKGKAKALAAMAEPASAGN